MVPVTGSGAIGGSATSGATRHNVEVVTTITTNATQASRATQELTKQTERLSAAQKEANARAGGVIGGGVPPGRVGLAAQPGDQGVAAQAAQAGRGGFGAMAGNVLAATGVSSALGAYAAPAATIVGLEAFLRAMNEVDNSALSTHQKLRELAGTIPLVGKAFFDTANMVYERSALGEERYAESRTRDQELPLRLASQSRERQLRFTTERLARDTGEADMAAYYGRTRQSPYDINRYEEMDTEPDPERRSYLGALTQAERGTAAADVARASAQRSAMEADMAARSQMTAAGQSQQEMARRQQRVLDAEGTYDLNATAENKDRLGQRARELAEQIRDATEKTGEAQNRLREAQEKGKTAAERELDYQRAKTQEMKAQLDFTERQKSKTETAMADFTLLPPDQQMRIMNASQRLKEQGLDGLRQEDREALQGFGPANELLRKEATTDAKKRVAEPDDALGRTLEYLGVPSLKRQEYDVKQQRLEIDGKMKIDEQQAREVLAKIFREFNAELKKIVQEEQAIAKATEDQKKAAEKAGQKAGS